MEPRALSFLAVIFIALSIFLSSSFALSHPREPFKAFFGEENLGSWKDEIYSAAAEAPGPANDVKTLILAGNRTKRPDILAGFHKYRGGWDIANRHYWADNAVLERWRDYFTRLLNETSTEEPDIDFHDMQEGRHLVFHRRASTKEVREALKRMKPGKPAGPDEIPIEVRKCLGEFGIQWLTRLFNRILATRKMPESWRHSVIVPIYKNKGDIQDCSNYRGSLRVIR